MKANKFENLNGKGLRIAIVQARFNEKITSGMKAGVLKALLASGVAQKSIETHVVPGSFEIPLLCKALAKSKKFDGIVTLGAVIKGETAHFDFVAGETARGIMQVMLEEKLPIAFGVITTYDLKQALARSKDNENNKGYEAALALIETISALKKVKAK